MKQFSHIFIFYALILGFIFSLVGTIATIGMKSLLYSPSIILLILTGYLLYKREKFFGTNSEIYTTCSYKYGLRSFIFFLCIGCIFLIGGFMSDGETSIGFYMYSIFTLPVGIGTTIISILIGRSKDKEGIKK